MVDPWGSPGMAAEGIRLAPRRLPEPPALPTREARSGEADQPPPQRSGEGVSALRSTRGVEPASEEAGSPDPGRADRETRTAHAEEGDRPDRGVGPIGAAPATVRYRPVAAGGRPADRSSCVPWGAGALPPSSRTACPAARPTRFVPPAPRSRRGGLAAAVRRLAIFRGKSGLSRWWRQFPGCSG